MYANYDNYQIGRVQLMTDKKEITRENITPDKCNVRDAFICV